MNKRIDDLAEDVTEQMSKSQADMIRAALDLAYWVGRRDGFNEARSLDAARTAQVPG